MTPDFIGFSRRAQGMAKHPAIESMPRGVLRNTTPFLFYTIGSHVSCFLNVDVVRSFGGKRLQR
ncbi:hypothetical protein BDZ94DRAFT_1249048 [Collybia nuda]|uniref:Uncharacterized protein n=1 Tax=Collybia nuda TaxID=64659 RepID=A0A9P5YG93_9AGAR|nr:hypothetical protein BDZ94DRAFT_1249048 [Collybia nuda]